VQIRDKKQINSNKLQYRCCIGRKQLLFALMIFSPKLFLTRFFFVSALLSISMFANAERFAVDEINVHLDDDVYYLDASLSLPLSSAALEAIKNGVPLFIALEVGIYAQRNWWLDNAIAKINQVFKVEYFELAKLYQTTNINTQEQNNFLSLSSALSSIGFIENLPLIDKVLLDENKSYYSAVQVDLLIKKLPLPLIPVALVFKEWEHQSLTHQLALK